MSFKQFGGKNKFNQSKEITTNSIISEFSYSKNATVQDTITIGEDNNLWNINTEFSGSNVSVLQAKPDYRTALFRVLDNSNNPIIHINANNGDTSLNQPNVDVKTDFFVRGNSKFFDSVNFDNQVVFNVPIPSADDHAANRKYVDDEIAGVSIGTLLGDLDMCNNKIVNMADPDDLQDAATKNYVDDRDALKLNLTGGTLTGNLNVNGDTNVGGRIVLNKDTFRFIRVIDPSSNEETLGFNYRVAAGENVPVSCLPSYYWRIRLDENTTTFGFTSVSGPLLFMGRTQGIQIYKPITMNGNQIIDLDDPTAPQHASTKNYIDTKLEDLDSISFTSTEGQKINLYKLNNDYAIGIKSSETYISTGNKFKLYLGDASNNNVVFETNNSNDVIIPNGNLNMSDMSGNQIEFSPVLGDKINLYNGGTNEFKIGVNSNETYITTGEKFHVYRGNSGDNQIQIATDNLDNVIIPNGNLNMSGNAITNISTISAQTDLSVSANTILLNSKLGNGQTEESGITFQGSRSGVGYYNEQTQMWSGSGKSIVLYSKNSNVDTAPFENRSLVISDNGTIGIHTFSPDNAYALDISGSTRITGVLNMNSNRIENVTDPSAAQDVVTKKYVDDAVDLKLHTGGGVLTGDLDMSNNNIVNLDEPNDGTDAANKNYVDNPYFYNLFTTVNDSLDNTTITGLPVGSGKWEGGVLAPNGKIYCIPRNAESVLIINPTTDTVDTTTITGLTGTNKWGGGVLAPNGKIYGIPLDSTSILIIDPATDTVDTTTITSLTGSNKWFGGVLAPDGKIYGIPFQSTSVLIIDTINNTADTTSITLNTTITNNNNNRWIGGVLKNNLIIGIPYSTNGNILVINTQLQTVSTGVGGGGTTVYFGGALAPNGSIYCIPFNASSVLKIVRNGLDGTYVGTTAIPGLSNLDPANSKWSGGVLAPNGKIYGIPYNFPRVLEINPETDTVTVYQDTDPLPNNAQSWQGGVLAPNGKIYCVPYSATTVLIINTGPPTMPSWMLSAHYNKL